MISVIVPVYNVEGYLPRCVESILLQSYGDFELLLIDDGSTDDSGKICDELQAQDSRIRVFHQDNQGPSAARNRGLDEMKGEYVCFIDADDFVHPRYLETLYSNLDKHDADCSYVQLKDVDHLSPIPDSNDLNEKELECQVLTPAAATEEILYQRFSRNEVAITCSPCASMQKASVWKGLRYREGIFYEDLDIFYRMLENCSKVVKCRATLYFYSARPGSTMQNFRPNRRDVLGVTRRIVEHMTKKGDDKLVAAALDRQLSANFNILLLMYANKMVIPETEEECWQTIKSLRKKSLFNPKVRLKNRVGILMSYIGGRWLFRRLRPH